MHEVATDILSCVVIRWALKKGQPFDEQQHWIHELCFVALSTADVVNVGFKWS
jgi:hypothetical protein